MNKKILYSLIAIVVVALGATVWWFFIRTPFLVTEEKSIVSPGIQKASAVTDTVQTSASSVVDKANPFSSNVNPVQGYKNPFE